MSLGLKALFLALALVRRASPQNRRPHSIADYRPSWGQSGKDVVWVPTPAVLLDDILAMARVRPGDRLLDLGAGDGRIVIAAAQRGAYAMGVEYDPRLARLARRNVRQAGVADRVWVRCADLFGAELGHADVITFYLMPHLNLRLRPELLALAPGTRLVSQSFGLGDWRPDAQVVRDGRCAFFWIVPAEVTGEWSVTHADGSPPQALRLTQRYQYVDGELHGPAGRRPLREGRLRGTEIDFALGRFGVGQRRYTGRVHGDTMAGSCIMPDGSWQPWSALRRSS